LILVLQRLAARIPVGGAPLRCSARLSPFLAGEPVDAVAAEFGLLRDEVEERLLPEC
jgi:hypothetical protein